MLKPAAAVLFAVRGERRFRKQLDLAVAQWRTDVKQVGYNETK
jgi:hypothetical protein